MMHEQVHCRDEAANRQLGLLNHLNSFHREMFKFYSKCHADLFLRSLSHFEYDGHTVHMVIQWHLWPPLTSTVKFSLFTHVHVSPLSLSARLHRCHVNHPPYINNGWTFFRQTLYVKKAQNYGEG